MMKHGSGLLLLGFVCAGAVVWCGRAEAGGCCGGSGLKASQGTSSYYVVAIKDSSGAKSVEALPYKEYMAREKTLKEDYVASYKMWKRDKSSPKPTKPGIIEVKKFKGKDGKAQAEALAARLQEKLDAKEQAKHDKELAKLDKQDATSAE
jgi:hypothetical protein